MTTQEKRDLRNKIQLGVSELISSLTTNDEEYFLALIYAQQQLAFHIADFDDIYV